MKHGDDVLQGGGGCLGRDHKGRPIVNGHVGREGREGCGEICQSRGEYLQGAGPRHREVSREPPNCGGVSNALGLGNPAPKQAGTVEYWANVETLDTMGQRRREYPVGPSDERRNRMGGGAGLRKQRCRR